MVQAYTQFVIGFEFGSMFWLLYSIAAFLFMRLMQQKPLVEAIETISSEGVVCSSPSAIVSSGCFSAPAQFQPVSQLLKEAVQVEQEPPEALEATLSLSTDSFLQLVQGTLGVTRRLSTAEQLMLDSIILAHAPAPVSQPQVAVEGAIASDPISFEEASVFDTSLLQKQVQSLSIRQAKALAKRLTTTQARIIGYSSMSLTTLVDQLLAPERLQHIAVLNIDVNALQTSLSAAKSKKQKKAKASLTKV